FYPSLYASTAAAPGGAPAGALGPVGHVSGDVSTAGLQPNILDDLALGHRYGLYLSSGYRPGAVTSSGNVSLHSIGEAIDMAGAESGMRGFARAEAGRPGVVEVIHSPYWWHPGSGWGTISDST